MFFRHCKSEPLTTIRNFSRPEPLEPFENSTTRTAIIRTFPKPTPKPFYICIPKDAVPLNMSMWDDFVAQRLTIIECGPTEHCEAIPRQNPRDHGYLKLTTIT